ncbi:MAG TPA: PLP-dependent aminotransferase family protein [Methylomirabilota bacterium]|nr:PLP-dependent aminotransferase family protein [Methylomirabilota bacterium]
MIHISLERSSSVPLVQQIRQRLSQLVHSGILTPGVKLPSTRELASTLRVNRTTVSAAYDALTNEGLLVSHVGQGTFVAPQDGLFPAPAPSLRAVPSFDWSALFSKASHLIASDMRGTEMAGVATGPGVISFAGGVPDSDLFPTNSFRQVLNKVVKTEGAELLQYAPLGGYLPLRRFLSAYLLRFGIQARADEILIVNGSQQGFDLIARTLLDSSDSVAIEQPTYPRAIQLFRSTGAHLFPITFGQDGLLLSQLERLLERQTPKLLYCQSSAHNPTGLSMDAASRRALIALANRHHFPLVEDGFDGGFYYGDPPAPPLKAQDPQGLVIYIGTFSKTLFPGLRLGWIVASPPLMERLQAAKQLSDIHTSPLIQAAVYHFCQRRLLERHVLRVAPEYGRRRAKLLSALDREMPHETSWTKPHGGFSLLVTLPAGIDSAELLPLAHGRGVSFTPGRVFFANGGGERHLRLSFSAVPTGKIEEGVRRLARAIRESMHRPARTSAADQLAVPLV